MYFRATIIGWDIPAKLRIVSEETAHELAVQAVHDMEDYVPYRSGRLWRGTKVKNEYIRWPGPYAAMLYRGNVMVDTVTRSPFARKSAGKKSIERSLRFRHSPHAKAQSYWFKAARDAKLKKWTKLAEKDLNRRLSKWVM